MLLQAEQIHKNHKMTTISLKIVEIVILSENTGHFVNCSACKGPASKISHVIIILQIKPEKVAEYTNLHRQF